MSLAVPFVKSFVTFLYENLATGLSHPYKNLKEERRDKHLKD